MRAKYLNPPRGTYGFVCAPWNVDEYYGIAADWAQASAPVFTLVGGAWRESGRQVADFWHKPRAALANHLEQILRDDGTEITDAVEDEVDRIVGSATLVDWRFCNLT